MIFLLFLLSLSLLLPACGKEAPTLEKHVYDFAESVTLIRHLLKTDSLIKILEDADPEGLERVINNFSPAQMALESEVLNCTLPVIIYFYDGLVEDAEFLEQLAQEHFDKVKIITIDAENFFSIAEQFEIQRYPTLIVMNKRDVLQRHSGTISKDQLAKMIKNCFGTIFG